MSHKTDESRITKTAMLKEIEKSTQRYNNLTSNDYVCSSIYIISNTYLLQHMYTIF